MKKIVLASLLMLGAIAGFNSDAANNARTATVASVFPVTMSCVQVRSLCASICNTKGAGSFNPIQCYASCVASHGCSFN